MLENDDLEIVDTKLEEEKQQQQEEERKQKELEEMEVIDDKSKIVDGIEIIEDGSNKKSKKWLVLILIVLLIAGCVYIYFMYDKYKEDNAVDNFEVVTSNDDIGNYFMDILNKNGFYYNSKHNYDITINYGQITDKLNLKIVFKSSKCTEDVDPNCNYFNTSKTINLIINDKEYKYYKGYNNSYDVIEGILKHGYVALLNNENEIYVVNNSDTVDTYELDQISKPSIDIFYTEFNNDWYEKYKYDNYYNVITKYSDLNNNLVDCQITYDKEQKSLTYCSNGINKNTIYGNNSNLNTYQLIPGSKKYTNNNEEKEYNSNPQVSKKGKDISFLNDVSINKLLNYFNQYYYDTDTDGIFTNNYIDINNINNNFILKFLTDTYINSNEHLTTCEQVYNYFDKNSTQVYDCETNDGYVMDHTYYVYKYNSLNELYKNVFNTTNDLPKGEYKTKLYTFKYIENDNIYIIDYFGGGLGPQDRLTTIVENYETEDDELYIYVRTMYDVRNYESNNEDTKYVYARPNKTKLIKRIKDDDSFTNEEYDKLFEQGQLYKFVFKKNSDDTYYWVSTKPI